MNDGVRDWILLVGLGATPALASSPWGAWFLWEDIPTPPRSAASYPTASSFQAPAPRSARVVVAEGVPGWDRLPGHPIDIVPDFIPAAGRLDDAIIVAIGPHSILRGSSDPLLDEH